MELENRFYIIKCFNGSESFIKVGTTGTKLTRRFSGKKMPYNWEVVREAFCSVRASLSIETAIEDAFDQYEPVNRFGGYLECFNCCDLDNIKAVSSKMLNELNGELS